MPFNNTNMAFNNEVDLGIEGYIQISESSLIERLYDIKNKLEENGLLDVEDELTISILIDHLEEMAND